MNMLYNGKNIEWQTNGIDMERVQDTLFDIGRSVCDILERHNCKYMIAFGTLLGAVRHKDMIPWDDDFDLFLFQEDYSKGSEYLRKELPETMFLEDKESEPNYFHAWSHVKDLKSEIHSDLYPADNIYLRKGIHVDLYRIQRIRLSELQNFLIKENKAYIDRRKKAGCITDEDYARRSGILFEEYALNDEIKDRDVYIFDGPYKKKTMEIEDAFPLKKYLIREHEFYGPGDADAVLRSIYGDYLSVPPYEQRKPKVSNIVFED